ncbi:MAG: DUF523 domain-containing protein [Candidatus Bathyarchaeota archaeon]|nr:DUF523 domain-containing protein [Candidatus Bathyarchaeota archaeon]
MTRIVISRCLGIEATRYNGKMIEAPWLKELAAKAQLVPVCPEFEIGLGVPRKPINLVKTDDGIRVIQDETGLDLSEELVSYSQGYLRFVGDVDAFILKSKSPSCGLGSTKIHVNEDYVLGSGIFADLASKLFPGVVIVDEQYMAENGVDALLELID